MNCLGAAKSSQADLCQVCDLLNSLAEKPMKRAQLLNLAKDRQFFIANAIIVSCSAREIEAGGQGANRPESTRDKARHGRAWKIYDRSINTVKEFHSRDFCGCRMRRYVRMKFDFPDCRALYGVTCLVCWHCTTEITASDGNFSRRRGLVSAVPTFARRRCIRKSMSP